MIFDGPLVISTPAFCARFGRQIEALMRAQCRRDGCPVDGELAEWFDELALAGDWYRSRYKADPDAGTPATMSTDMGSEDLAARLGLTGSYVRRLARQAVLPGRRVGGRWVFGADAIEKFEKGRAA